jgi:hypothetical protein
MKLSYLVYFLAFCTNSLMAQAQPPKILSANDLQRLRSFQRYVDAAQTELNKIDGKPDSLIKLGNNTDLNLLYTDAVNRQIDDLQKAIDAEKKFDYEARKNAIVSLESFIKLLNTNARDWMRNKNKLYPIENIVGFIKGFKDAIYLANDKKSIAPVLEILSYKEGDILTKVPFLQTNAKTNKAISIVALKYAAMFPKELIKVLKNYPGEIANEDELLIKATRANPNTLYSYVQDTGRRNSLMPLVRRSNDKLVQTITKIAQRNNGQKIMPFVDNIISGKQNIDEIDRISGGADSVAFYRLLVNTQLNYAQRMLLRDTPLLYDQMQLKLKEWSYDYFVHWINELHDHPNTNYRLRSSDNLTATEIYYLLVNNEEEIYTSSYRLLFDRMLSRTPGTRGDSLLIMVSTDKFKKFIKMAANYNRLSPFLNSMPMATGQALMDAFVSNIENSLEEATDVADAYSSIKDSTIKVSMKSKMDRIYDLALKNNNKKVQLMYGLELDVINGYDNPNFNWATIGVSSPFEMNLNRLKDTGGKINILMFFYGDKDQDGQTSFQSFIRTFSNGNWDISGNPEWVVVKSKKGTIPVTFYANRPLYNPKLKPEPDQVAQENLINFLQKNNINPKVVVHRGHSYHTEYTIEQMYSEPSMVFLGSCGGYKLLNQILAKGDDSHIISTKQVGTKSVNDPMLKDLSESIAQNKPINWPQMWERLKAGPLKANKEFEDYIPPHKNLGALFLKAYEYKLKNQPVALP